MTAERYKLPKGWVWTALTDISNIIMGQSPPSSSYNLNKKGLPFFQGKAEFGELFPEPIKWCTSPKKSAQPDDVLISVRAPVGPTNLANQTCCIGRGLAAIRSLNNIPSKLILYYFRSVESELSKQGQGSTFTAINKNDLENIPFPLPPKNEQKRIVQKIDNLLDRLNKTKQELAKIPPLIKKFRQSVLAKAFTGELTEEWRESHKDLEPASVLLDRIHTERKKQLGKEYKATEPIDTSSLPELPKGWLWTTVREAAEVTTGNTPPKSDRSNYGKFLPWVKPPQLDSDKPIIDTPEKLSEKGAKLARVLPKDSVLVSCIGLLGKVGFAGCELATNQQINALTFGKGVFPKYGYSYCKSKYFWDWLESIASATTVPIVNKERFSKTPIPIAPLDEQHQIVGKIEDLFARVDSIEKAVQVAQVHCEKLNQSTLAQAFRGELVEQDPDNEPASTLLEKIKSEKSRTSLHRMK